MVSYKLNILFSICAVKKSTELNILLTYDLAVMHMVSAQRSWEPVCMCESLNHVQLFESPWAVAHQDPLSMVILQARILE